MREDVIPVPDVLRQSPIVQPGYRKGEHPANYGRTLPPEPLTRDELERLLGTFGQGPCAKRNVALIVVMWRSGLRVAETLALDPKDIDARAGTVTVLRGKGSKRRQVALDGYALAALERWMAIRARIGIGPRAPLFCCVDIRTLGKRMHSAYVRGMLKAHADKAGILKRVHPHGLRHTLAFELMMEGQPINVIRDQLGHSQLSTTLRYCDHLAPSATIRAMQDRPPPGFGLEPLPKVAAPSWRRP